VYLLRVVEQLGAAPNAKIPRVLLPAPDPLYEAVLAAPTPEAVDVQLEYVYLLRVVLPAKLTRPIAKIPLVLLPTAELQDEEQLAAPTPVAVELQVAYVYLFLVVEVEPEMLPRAKMPLLPSFKQQLAPAANRPNP